MFLKGQTLSLTISIISASLAGMLSNSSIHIDSLLNAGISSVTKYLNFLNSNLNALSDKSLAKHGQPEPREKRWVGRTPKNPPIKFRLAADGTPVADMKGRRGGPIKEQKLKFIWDFRTLSGTAPEGCVSTSPEWVAAR